MTRSKSLLYYWLFNTIYALLSAYLLIKVVPGEFIFLSYCILAGGYYFLQKEVCGWLDEEEENFKKKRILETKREREMGINRAYNKPVTIPPPTPQERAKRIWG